MLIREDQKPMSPRHLMVIVGSGASHDSIDDPTVRAGGIKAASEDFGWEGGSARAERLSWRPPLTDELFGPRRRFQLALRRYPLAGDLIDRRLRGAVTEQNSVEKVLDEVAEAAADPRNASIRRQLTALRFYLREITWDCGHNWEAEIAPGQTNFHRLVANLVRWQETTDARLTFVSFNYDLMLDNAIETHGRLKLRDLDAYCGDERLQLFKPHGSSNWVRATDIPFLDYATDVEARLQEHTADRMHFFADLVIDRAGADVNFAAGGAWRVIGQWQEPEVRGGDKRLVLGFPALTVPIISKDAFELPTEHKTALSSAFATLTHVLTIGWRAREKNFLKLWSDAPKQNRPMLQTVTKTQAGAAQVATALEATGRISKTLKPVLTFSSLMKDVDAPDGPLQAFLMSALPGLP